MQLLGKTGKQQPPLEWRSLAEASEDSSSELPLKNDIKETSMEREIVWNAQ